MSEVPLLTLSQNNKSNVLKRYLGRQNLFSNDINSCELKIYKSVVVQRIMGVQRKSESLEN